MTSAPFSKRILMHLIIVQVFIHACMSGLRMAAPLLALREGHSTVEVGVLLGLFAVTQLFISLPAGRYADRHTLKRPVGISVVLTVLGLALPALWPIYPVLCLSALLCGGATGSALIALQRHAGRMATDRTRLKQVFSWLAVAPAFSNFLGPFVTGFLIDYAGFRAAFGVLSLLPLISWLGVRSAPELPKPTKPESETRLRAFDLLAIPRLRRLLLINWTLASCWDVHTFVLPVLGYERGFSAAVIGTILGIFAVAATTVRLVIPLIAGRLQEWAVMGTAMLAAGAILWIYPLSQSPVSMGLCSVLLGFALGSVQPMILATLHQSTPEHRHGEALGLRMMTINASSIVMPMLFGWAGAVVGVSVVFWTVGSVVACGARLAFGLRRQP